MIRHCLSGLWCVRGARAPLTFKLPCQPQETPRRRACVFAELRIYAVSQHATSSSKRASRD